MFEDDSNTGLSTASGSGSANIDWGKAHSVPFRNPDYVPSSSGGQTGPKTRAKTLKQMLAAENAAGRDGHYSAINAPTSFRPAKKYSDLSGLPAPYTDPHTKLRYANAAEYAEIKKMPSDIVGGYLTLRRANTQLQ